MRSWVNPSTLGASSVKWDITELCLPVLDVGEQMSLPGLQGSFLKESGGLFLVLCHSRLDSSMVLMACVSLMAS